MKSTKKQIEWLEKMQSISVWTKGSKPAPKECSCSLADAELVGFVVRAPFIPKRKREEQSFSA